MHEALLSVLIADDEYWIRESLRTALDWPAYGMSFLEPACDGEEALTTLKSRHVDILITDINMPYLSGVELIRQAQSVSPQTAILVLSGYSDYEYVRQALLAGALDYLLKPISKASLLEALDKAIDKVLRRQREERDRTELQKKLSAAASAMLDRDFSELLHAARHQAQAQDVEAQLFEYEQRFSGYRLTLLDVPGASTANGAAIKELLEETISLRPRLIIRNLYHLTHYLLITPTDAGALSETLAAVAQALLKHTGSPARAVISEACLSFGDLRKVYNETRTVLLTLPMRPGSEVVFAARQERRPLSQRLSPALQKQMEQAVRMQQRDWFDRLVEQTGLWSPQAQEWPQMEYLHCVTAIAWVLHRSVEERGDAAQALAVETLIDTLPMAFSQPVQLRETLMQMEDEAFWSAPCGESATGVMEQVRQYVDAHYIEDLSLGDLASRFGLDGSYLSRSFKQAAGSNLTVYVTQLRVAEAKRLLQRRELSITEVAQAVGYGDYAYFSRVFKKLTGISPRQYREAGDDG